MHKKTYVTLAGAFLIAGLMQGCGGGGDGGAAPVANGGNNAPVVPPADGGNNPLNPPASSDEGSVSAPFVRTDASRFIMIATDGETFGSLTADSVQTASGAMTALDKNNVLLGVSVTKNISGDASFALGRWAVGTVSSEAGDETLTGTDNRAYHYLVFNRVTTVPDTGSAHCDSGSFTTPTYVSGGPANSAISGRASGSAKVSFNADGAIVTGAINVSAGADGTSVGLPGKIERIYVGGLMLTGGLVDVRLGSGAGVQLTDVGNGNYALVVPYAAVMPNGARYRGVARLSCTPIT